MAWSIKDKEWQRRSFEVARRMAIETSRSERLWLFYELQNAVCGSSEDCDVKEHKENCLLSKIKGNKH